MRPLRLLLPWFAAASVALAAGCDDDNTLADGTLFVDNQSDFTIVELYVTEVDNSTWGPNLLGADVLLPGESVTIPVACDIYDALLVDEDGVDCEINAIDLCLNDADWIIRNETCTVFGAKQAERAAAAKASQAPPASTTTD